MLATILSRAQYGMEAPLVRVEVDIGSGLPAFAIVGLPEAVVKESKDRVRAAIANSNFDFPSAGRITVNLSPADLPKEGGRFDLPIALGVLIASEQLSPPASLQDCEFYGELSLSGELRPVCGMLPTVCQAVSSAHRVILPRPNLDEARLVERAEVAAAGHLLEVCAHLKGEEPLAFVHACKADKPAVVYPDLAEVHGQVQAKRALEIAAAGGHSLLFVGPPGTGKSMLAHRLPGVLPPMTTNEAFEAAAVASIAQGFRVEHWGRRPFRAPHHTSSAVALVGGGSHPRPGEISLAHHGVLFLDELPEFDRRVLESLREPLETGSITISRAARQTDFPARFQLVAALNPCPCGFLGDPDGRCRCTPGQVERYRERISGPLLDRIDLHVQVPRLDAFQLWRKSSCTESSAAVLKRVTQARTMQLARGTAPNAQLTNPEVEQLCPLEPAARRLLEHSIAKLRLSARAYHRIRKVARTIADLDGQETIAPTHVGEAVQLRRFKSG